MSETALHKNFFFNLQDKPYENLLRPLDQCVSLCGVVCFRVFDVATRSHADLPTCHSLRFDRQPAIVSHFKCGVPLNFA